MHRRHRPRSFRPASLSPVSFSSFALAASVGVVSLPAAESIDETKLPPPATGTIDFVRDVRPIFEQSCLKCHGPEQPKGGFRLDQRDLLLKGGDSGVAVVPRQSTISPLIHFAARMVPDMEMPPPGKGDPLTPAQIGTLRAWIDQGAPWGGKAPSSTVVDLSPTFRWIDVNGNEGKFRELEWMRGGWDAGVERFFIREQLTPDRRVTVEGHALRDNYQVKLSLEQGRHFFVNAGFQQYRKWFADDGGYYGPFTPQVSSLDRDLFVDWGKAWAEVGGTLPNGLELLAGYEFRFQDGERAMTQWLPATQTLTSGDVTRSVLPTTKHVDEQLHVLRLDAVKEWSKVRLEDRFRYEFYDLNTRHTSVLNAFPFTLYTQRARGREEFRTAANAFSGEWAPVDGLLFSGGYLYRHMDGATAFDQRPIEATGGTPVGLLWTSRGVPIEQSSHILNGNIQGGPWAGWIASAGVQADWTRQESFGRVRLDETDPGDPTLVATNRATIGGDYDRFTLQETASIKMTAIPFTVVYADARWQQEGISQFQFQDAEVPSSSSVSFLRDTDASYVWQQYRAGFNTSPWSRVSFNPYYQYRFRDDSFDHNRDERPIGGTDGPGYPGFITARETETHEAGARLVLRPLSWLKSTLSYRLISTDFRTQSDPIGAPFPSPGGWNLAGESDAHIYALNVTLTPWRRVYLFATAAYQDTRTIANDNGSQAVAPYRGDIYSGMASASYVLAEPTDLHLTYDFSHADYTQSNEEFGLPLGIDYQRHGLRAGLTHRFWKRFVARAEYAWFKYLEPSGGGYGDYVAHGVFTTLNMRWQ